MTRRNWIALVLCGAVTIAAHDATSARKKKDKNVMPPESAEPARPPETGIDVWIGDGMHRTTVVFPGRMVGYALPRTAEGTRRLVALIDPENPEPDPVPEPDENAPPPPRVQPDCPVDESEATAPRLNLYEFTGETLVPLRTGIPADVGGIEALDVDGDGVDEIVLTRSGSREVLGDDADRDRVIVKDPELRYFASAPREQSGRQIVTRGDGLMKLYRPGEDGSWGPVAQIELPTRARSRQGGYDVWTIPARRAGESTTGSQFWVTAPQAGGVHRVESRVIEVAADGTATTHDAWGRLPEPEEMMEYFIRMLDDRPVLLVTTRPANKLNLFGEKRVRVFGLDPDRSRLGIAPRFAFESRMNLWQEANVRFVDVNADGRDDLVLGYWKGMKDDRVVLDVYLRNSAGGFEITPRSTGFDVEDASRSFVEFGRDLDGSGHPDLVVRASGRLVMYPGRSTKSAKNVVDPEAPLVLLDAVAGRGDEYVEIGMSSSGRSHIATRGFTDAPEIVDLDGDGLAEIIVSTPGGGGWPGIIRYTSFGTPP